MSDPLSPNERQQLDVLFERAADLPQSEHPSFIASECGSSVALGVALARLLAGLAGQDKVQQAQRVASYGAGIRVGPYKLLEKIGEGGMGEVYAADQLEPVVRRVALKVIKVGMDSAQVVLRFEAERQALARMSHPNIAQVFDGGTTHEGRPYFAMEYVAGDPITEYCDRRKLSTRERVELFLGVCDGVQHAHQKGIVHRDLKPSNLLVMEQDGQALPKVIDFGIARAMTGRLTERTMHTMMGQVIGTLDYMSPEQADPTGVDVDTRSDIYSLGVLLYQIVSGHLPFEHNLGGDTRFSEVQRAIREVDAPTPSTRLQQQAETATGIAALRSTDERSLVRELRGDLDWISLKALEKDPARRYASVSELADDLRRHLAHEPVLAGRPGTLYRARKFIRRHRVGVMAGALVTLALIAGIAGVVAGQLEARASDDKARVVMDAYGIVGLEVESDTLWPPHPKKIVDMEYWVSRAEDVVQKLPRYRMRRESLRPHATSTEATFEQQQTYDSIVKAIQGGEQLRTGLLAAESVTVKHGWSMPKRLQFARELMEGFASGGKYARAWDEARVDVEAELRDGKISEDLANDFLNLQPQLGLLPLGRDPDYDMWEFADLATGAVATRDGDGRLRITAGTGLVLVLIPERHFEMGDDAVPSASPQHTVQLSSYFLSKFEMTQGQWARLTGVNPSAYRPGVKWVKEWLTDEDSDYLLHPVEQVSWIDCDKWLRRVGLSLPSEAQWECGARGGAESRFSSGIDELVVSLKGVANVRDETMKQGGLEHWESYEEGTDGAVVHWAVGTGEANKFGLHDVHGNVIEWCLDGYAAGPRGYDGAEYVSSSDVDPVAVGRSDLLCIIRGGCFRLMRIDAEPARRAYYPVSFAGSGCGVRPARAVTE